MKIWPASLIILLSANACQAEQTKLKQAENTADTSRHKITDSKAKNRELADQIAQNVDIYTKPDGPIRDVNFTDNTTILVEPIKIFSRPGGFYEEDCAVRINGGLTVTIGEKEEDSFCNNLQEIGALPSARSMRKMGLIYSMVSSNNNSTTSIVLVESSPGNWTVDNAAFVKMNHDSGPKTIPEVVKWMNDHAKVQ
jgi:hypothetical protein